jgi:hypothetical protein
MIALAGLPDHHLSMNAPPGAQILIIVLMNHEAWGCDLDERGINGPAWCFQLYLLWTGASFVRSKAWGNRCGKGRERGPFSAQSLDAQLGKAAISSNGGHSPGGDWIRPAMGALAGNVPLTVVALVCDCFL